MITRAAAYNEVSIGLVFTANANQKAKVQAAKKLGKTLKSQVN